VHVNDKYINYNIHIKVKEMVKSNGCLISILLIMASLSSPSHGLISLPGIDIYNPCHNWGCRALFTCGRP